MSRFSSQLKLLLTVWIISTLAGCASYPSDPASQADHHLKLGSEAISRSETSLAIYEFLTAIEKPTGKEKARALGVTQPRIAAALRGFFDIRVVSVSTADEANTAFDQITRLSDAGLMQKDAAAALLVRLNDRALSGIRSGELKFTLGADFSRFPGLASTENEKYLVDNTVALLQSGQADGRQSSLIGLTQYVARQGVQSAEAVRIKALLSSFKLKKSEIALIRTAFSEYAAQREKEVALKVNFALKGGDRLLRDDLQNMIGAHARGLEFVPSEGEASLLLTVERIRHDEREQPERTQTVTYSWTDVNMVAAVLLMPKNASYLFEQVSGGAEIDYGYVVSWTFKPAERGETVVRGKVGGPYSRCQNRRIQNVFGGVSSADFVANDDMARRCSGRQDVSMDSLRSEIIEKILDAVKEIPQIKNVDELNR